MLFSVDYCGGVHRAISSLSIQNLVVTKLSKKKKLFCVNLMLKLLYVWCKNIGIFFKAAMCFYRYFKTSYVIGVWNSPCKTSHLRRMLPHATAVAAKPRISGSMAYPAAWRSN